MADPRPRDKSPTLVPRPGQLVSYAYVFGEQPEVFDHTGQALFQRVWLHPPDARHHCCLVIATSEQKIHRWIDREIPSRVLLLLSASVLFVAPSWMVEVTP